MATSTTIIERHGTHRVATHGSSPDPPDSVSGRPSEESACRSGYRGRCAREHRRRVATRCSRTTNPLGKLDPNGWMLGRVASLLRGRQTNERMKRGDHGRFEPSSGHLTADVTRDEVMEIHHIDFLDDPAVIRVACERARQLAFASFDDADYGHVLLGHVLEELMPVVDARGCLAIIAVLVEALGTATSYLAFDMLPGEVPPGEETVGEARRLLAAVFDVLEASVEE
jgi:hypothetical protein